MESAIRTTGLTVERGGVQVVRDLSIDVPAGKVTGLMGPSGCGKTTLMRSIVGSQQRVSGEVTVLGEPAGTPGLRRRVGYTTQSPSVYLDLTVRENLTFFARVVGAGSDSVDAALETVELTGYADRVVARLSGGQRSRVSIATALLGNPELLVLDEPTVGLDPVLRRDLWQTFHRLADGGVTLLVSSHVMDEAARCDSLILMRDGQLVASLTPAELVDRTGEDNLEHAFLRLIELTDGRRDEVTR